jgi:hypothetical protein
MGYKIQTAYCWYDKGSQIVKMYFINHVPFTFDDLADDASSNLELIQLADNQRRYDPEDLYKSSFYLIDEECHPMLFDMDIENPEDMPEDYNPDYFLQ